ncbi:MAG: putative ribose-5-phosphate isomerase B [Bacteroidetes bacterium ADurb.Bin408]|nr:MAG: putative ribose-5-phosphate isomerase B [Bacteroidetes bacterium ADurb.Bin408]
MSKNLLKISLASDHAGFEYKEIIKEYLKSKYFAEVTDFGTYSTESMDYPDVAHILAFSVVNKSADIGIILCGSGNGVCMTVNKYARIRAALCWKKEIAVLARQHNDANVLCLPARFVTIEEACEMVDVFLNTPFEGGRHQKRVDKISDIKN